MTNKIFKRFAQIALTGVFLFNAPVTFATADLAETAGSTGSAGSFLASRVAIDDNDDDAAVEFLERAHGLDPENHNIKQDLFAAYVSNGRLEDAAKIARGAKKLGGATNLRGFVLAAEAMRKRTWKNVSSAMKDVAGVDLDRTLREITLAWASSGLGETEKAYSRLDDLDGPEWVTVLKDYHAGLIAAANGQNDIAQKRLQSVIDNRAVISVLTETYIRAIEAKVRSHQQSGNKQQASDVLEYGTSLLPSHSPFLELQKDLEAGAALKPLVSSPQHGMAEIFYNVASALRRDNGGSISKTYFQLAHFLAPQSDVIKIGLAEVYLQQGNYEKSNLFYDKVRGQSPFYRISRLEIAGNLSRLGKTEDAITEFDRLIAENPNDITGYLTLGTLYNREKRYREAANTFDIAVDKLGDPRRQDWNLFFRRGISYERLKEWEKAEPNFKIALELSKDQPEVLNYLGYSWIDQGIHLEEGMDLIRKAVELRPRSGFIVDSLGWAYYKLGKYEEAVTELERAVSLMPQDPTINDHLGDAYWQVGRKLEATFQWKIALASNTEPENPELIRKKLANGLTEEIKAEAKAAE